MRGRAVVIHSASASDARSEGHPGLRDLLLRFRRQIGASGSRPFAAVNSRARFRFPRLSLCGGDLLVEGVWVGLLVFDSVEVLAVNVGEGGAVAGVAEEQVEDRKDE